MHVPVEGVAQAAFVDSRMLQEPPGVVQLDRAPKRQKVWLVSRLNLNVC